MTTAENKNIRLTVLIASHLNVIERLYTIKYALTSIANNTTLPDYVYISYSTEPDIELKIDTNEWDSILKLIPHAFYKQPKKTLQFAHYKYLSDNVVKDTDIVTFLDDDDLVSEIKYEKIKNYIANRDTIDDLSLVLWHPAIDFYDNGDSLIKSIDNIRESEELLYQEYWCLVLRGKKFRDWFKGEIDNLPFNQALEKYKHCLDIIFNCMLSTDAVKFTDEALLYFRKSLSLKRGYP